MPARIGKQGLVVGAGMAGLMAARSLADFFEHVIVLENDALPKEAAHRQGKFPRALLPFGDAICRFNPIYGQGMSVAALEADVLNGLLIAESAESDGYEKLAREFFADAEKLIDTPWSAAATPDFIDPRTEGQRPADFEDSLKFFAAF